MQCNVQVWGYGRCGIKHHSVMYPQALGSPVQGFGFRVSVLGLCDHGEKREDVSLKETTEYEVMLLRF
jgi:hypothetical protein